MGTYTRKSGFLALWLKQYSTVLGVLGLEPEVFLSLDASRLSKQQAMGTWGDKCDREE